MAKWFVKDGLQLHIEPQLTIYLVVPTKDVNMLSLSIFKHLGPSHCGISGVVLALQALYIGKNDNCPS